MNPLASVAAVYEHMDRARGGGPRLTNFYPVPEKLQRWVDAGALFSVSAENAVFVLRRDRDFLHLYYVASRLADLAGALAELPARETTAVDVIGKAAQIDETAAVFEQHGFARRTALHRMTRTTAGTADANEPAPDDPEVVLAEPGDGPALAQMLEAALDRHVEQIPDADEMARAAFAQQVLVIRAGAAIAGLLFYEVTGQSSLLRHWLVDSAHRDRRIGARLMRRYFGDCAQVRRFVLWVISDNDNAIDRYRHYGYQRDGLIDQVLMRQAS